jgi:hypothetical protein
VRLCANLLRFDLVNQASLPFLILMIAVTCSNAFAVKIDIANDDKHPTINGRIGDDASFSTEIRLTASEAVSNLRLLSSDLKPDCASLSEADCGSSVIERGQVTLANSDEITLEPGVPQDVKLRVASVKVPGTYRGSIQFWGLGSLMMELPLVVTAVSPPMLSPRNGTDAIKLQVVTCSSASLSSLDCLIARLLLPAQVMTDAFPLLFNNDSLSTVSALAGISAVGDQTRHVLTEKELLLSVDGQQQASRNSNLELKPMPISRLNLQLQLDNSPADHYVGDIRLRLVGQESPISLPLDISVRNGPGIAVLLLLFGVILGRIQKFVAESTGPQNVLLKLKKVLRSEEWKKEAMHLDDQAILQPILDQANKHASDNDADALKKDLSRITKFRHLLRYLRNTALNLPKDESTRKALSDEIQKARDAIKTGQDDAESLVCSIRKQAPPATPALRDDTSASLTGGQNLKRHSSRSPCHVQSWRWLRNVPGFITGHASEAPLWGARGVLYIFLIVLLVLVGLEQLYVKNLTFGANPLTDYSSLLFWAMSSDVASRTLSTVGGTGS